MHCSAEGSTISQKNHFKKFHKKSVTKHHCRCCSIGTVTHWQHGPFTLWSNDTVVQLHGFCIDTVVNWPPLVQKMWHHSRGAQTDFLCSKKRGTFTFYKYKGFYNSVSLIVQLPSPNYGLRNSGWYVVVSCLFRIALRDIKRSFRNLMIFNASFE